jgi:hypothetical protein
MGNVDWKAMRDSKDAQILMENSPGLLYNNVLCRIMRSAAGNIPFHDSGNRGKYKGGK